MEADRVRGYVWGMERSSPPSRGQAPPGRPPVETKMPPGVGLPRGPLRLSALALLIEDLTRRLWPAFTWAALTLAALLSDGLPRLPGWLHLLALTALLSMTAATLTQGLRGWRPPTRARARARLEAAAGAEAHRPWTAAADSLALGADDSLTRALWSRHQAAMASHARTLRPSPPRPRLARHDPQAFRILALILLFVSMAIAWPDPWSRVERGLSPRLGAPPPPVMAQLWITPPDYTGRAPLYLQASPDDPGGGTAAPSSSPSPSPVNPVMAGLPPLSAEPLTVPVGSTVLALMRGGKGVGLLDLGADRVGAPVELAAMGEGGQRLEILLETGSRLRLTQAGRALIDRPLIVVPDHPPTIAFAERPAADGRGALRLVYRAEDDHGIATLRALVRPAGGQRLGDPLDLDLPPPQALPGQAEAHDPHEARRDLRAHPWAGTPITLRLRAVDARGQAADTETVTLTLPERRFTHPVAQAVADLRRALVLAPDRAGAVALGLHALADDPVAFDERLPVFLALKAAAARLSLAPDGRARAEDLPPLWAIALALEDGSLALARRALEDARAALREAIDEGASADEVQRRLEAVREAMARLLESLAESLPLASLPLAAPLPDMGPTLRPDDIGRMLDDLAALNDLGAEDAARALLDRLDQMLEQLQAARPPTAEELRAMAELAEMARRLRDLAERQQALLDETFALDPEAADRDGRAPGDDPLANLLDGVPPHRLPPALNGLEPGAPLPFGLAPEGGGPSLDADDLRRWLERPPTSGAGRLDESAPEGERTEGAPSEATRDLAARQEALRQALEDMMADLGERLGEVPSALGEANLAMRQAEQALADGDTGAAARAQGRALEALRQGGGQAMAGMAGQMGLRSLGLGGMGALPGSAPGMGRGFGRGWGEGRDPLDRPTGRGADDDSVRLPTEPDARRAREILQELRRRANEAERPLPERDYLDRLIEPF